jgi:ADP-ribosylation factor-like protein 2
MGLLSIIKKTKRKEKEMRILILGLDNSGKTTIVKKFNNEDINEIAPTLGFNINTLGILAVKQRNHQTTYFKFKNLLEK